jgi:RNA 3'-phosphate cyclase
MIQIDGSIGGGQVLRTALGLSILLNKPFSLNNIRIKRSNPGLQEQYLQAVISSTLISSAEVIGAYKGSLELRFFPKEIKNQKISIEIKTAGSVGLVLQPLLIVGLKHRLEGEIYGGATYGKWAASIDFVGNVLGFWLKKLGVELKLDVIKHGFYPKGGSIVKFLVEPKESEVAKTINVSGKLKKIKIISVSSVGLKKREVAERMTNKACEILEKLNCKIEKDIKYVESICDGCGITIFAEFEDGIIGSSSVGEVVRTAEDVGKEIATMLYEDTESFGLDRFSSDQVLPFAAYHGCEVYVSRITEHVLSNIEVIKKFLDVETKIENRKIVFISKNF